MWCGDVHSWLVRVCEGLSKGEPTVFIRPDQVRPDISGGHMYVWGENRLTSHNSWEMFERLACFLDMLVGKLSRFHLHVGGKLLGDFCCNPLTPRKTNMSPENQWFGNVFPIEIGTF